MESACQKAGRSLTTEAGCAQKSKLHIELHSQMSVIWDVLYSLVDTDISEVPTTSRVQPYSYSSPSESLSRKWIVFSQTFLFTYLTVLQFKIPFPMALQV